MPFPYVVAKFNKRVTNRFIEPIARRTSGFAVVHHQGRSSGRPYRTPINVFALEADVIAALTYGTRADWFKNVQAGGGSLETSTGTQTIERVERVGRDVAWPVLPWFVRIALRILTVHDFARISTDTGGVRTGG